MTCQPFASSKISGPSKPILFIILTIRPPINSKALKPFAFVISNFINPKTKPPSQVPTCASILTTSFAYSCFAIYSVVHNCLIFHILFFICLVSEKHLGKFEDVNNYKFRFNAALTQLGFRF